MLNPLSFIKLPVLLSFYFITSWAHAQIYSSSSSAATGGTGRAAVEVGDGNYLNPASLVHLQGRYFFLSGTKEDLAVSLSETTRESILPASLSYLQKKYDDPAKNKIKITDLRLSVADFVVEKFSMGVTAVMDSSKINDNTYNQNNADMGFFYTPTDHFGMALVFYNIFTPNENIPRQLQLQQQIALGTNYIYKAFMRFRLDLESAPNNTFNKPTVMVGMESIVSQFVAVRLGYQKDNFAPDELFTAGIGFNGPVFSLSYAYQGSTKDTEFNRQSVDLSIPF